MKSLGASMAAYGSIALYHIEDLTPEAGAHNKKDVKERIHVEAEDIKNAYAEMSAKLENVDLILVGCPHASVDEIMEIYRLLDGRKLIIEMWIFTSRPVKNLIERMKLAKKLNELNVKLIEDTCPVVAPIAEMGIKKVAVNSGKAAYYLPNTNGQVVLFNSLKNLIEMFAR